MSINKICIYNHAPKYHTYFMGNQAVATTGYPYCQFCCEKKKIKAELNSLAAVLDGAGKHSYIPKDYLQRTTEPNVAPKVGTGYKLGSSTSFEKLKDAYARASYHQSTLRMKAGKSKATPISEHLQCGLPPLATHQSAPEMGHLSNRRRWLIEGNPDYIRRQSLGSRYIKRDPLRITEWPKGSSSMNRPMYWPSDRLKTERESRDERNVFDGIPNSYILNCKCRKRMNIAKISPDQPGNKCSCKEEDGVVLPPIKANPSLTVEPIVG